LHAVRAQRYRERNAKRVAKFAAQKVTHHPVTQAASSSTSPSTHAAEGRVANEREDHEVSEIGATGLRCSMCHGPLPRWARRRRGCSSTSRTRAPRLPTGPPKR
jgi:hypothetical protein